MTLLPILFITFISCGHACFLLKQCITKGAISVRVYRDRFHVTAESDRTAADDEGLDFSDDDNEICWHLSRMPAY